MIQFIYSRVATKETGIKKFKIIDKNIFMINTLYILGYIKKHKYISSYINLLAIDKTEFFQIKKSGNCLFT